MFLFDQTKMKCVERFIEVETDVKGATRTEGDGTNFLDQPRCIRRGSSREQNVVYQGANTKISCIL